MGKKNRKKSSSSIEIPIDVFRIIIENSSSSRSLLALKNLNNSTKSLVIDEINLLTKIKPLTLNIGKLFSEENLFKQTFFNPEETSHRKELHQNIRNLCDLLEAFSEINGNFTITGLNELSVGFVDENSELIRNRAPFMLQKRLMVILRKFNCKNVEFCPVLMRPSRYIRSISNRYEMITHLDLGKTRPLAVLKFRQSMFPSLLNLESLTWHHAKTSLLKKLKNPLKVKQLSLTDHPVGSPKYTDYCLLSVFENIEGLYFGFTVAETPTRMYMDILLNLYQAIWKKSLGDENKKMLYYFPKLKSIGFWNAPEKIFIDFIREDLSIETMNFGLLSQDLSRLCSFDSVMQALFKHEESKACDDSPKITNLNLNLHSMPCVPLEYYFPNLMDRINKMRHIKSLSLFVKCIYNSEMCSSWSLETNKQKMKKKPILDSTYTHFSLHCNGICEVTDLDRQLPSTLQACSISINLPPENSKKTVKTLIKFIEKLSDINGFPDLNELNIQITGIRCMEVLVDSIVDNLGGCLNKLSIYAMPCNENKKVCKNLITKVANGCTKLESFKVSKEFLELLMEKEQLLSYQWKQNVQNWGSQFDLKSTCQFNVGMLPEKNYIVKKEYPIEYEDDSDEDDEENKENIEEEVEDEEENSFIVDEDEQKESDNESLDELDHLEQKLKRESSRRQNKYENRRRVKSFSSSDGEVEEVDEGSIIGSDDEDEEGNIEPPRRRNGFIDDEAEESDREEDDENIEDEEEEDENDYEDLQDSDDEELITEDILTNGNGRIKRKSEKVEDPIAKRRKIIISDDDDDEN